MQPTRPIPHGWKYPRFTLGQRTIRSAQIHTLLIQNSKFMKMKLILHFEFCILNCSVINS